MALKNIQMYCLNGFETAEQMDLVLLSRDRKLKMVVTQIKQKRNSDPHVDIGCSGLVWWSMITKDPAASLLLLQHLQPTASTSRSKVAASAPANMLTFQPARRSKQKRACPFLSGTLSGRCRTAHPLTSHWSDHWQDHNQLQGRPRIMQFF